MKEFPKKLIPKNRHLFSQMNFNDLLEKWRLKVYNYIIKNEKNGFDLCDENNIPIDKRIIECLVFELSNLGWKTSLAYNGTLLFIYEHESEIEKYKHSLSDEIFE